MLCERFMFQISALLALSCAWANPPPCHEKGCPNVTMYLGPKWGSKVIYPNYPKFRGPSEQEPSSVNITLSDSDDQVELFADAVENDRRVPVPNRRPVPDDDSFTLDFPKDDFDPQALTPSRTANDILFEIPRLPFIFDLGLLNFTGQNLTGDGLKEKLSQQSAESLLHVRRLYLNNNKIRKQAFLTFFIVQWYIKSVTSSDVSSTNSEVGNIVFDCITIGAWQLLRHLLSEHFVAFKKSRVPKVLEEKKAAWNDIAEEKSKIIRFTEQFQLAQNPIRLMMIQASTEQHIVTSSKERPEVKIPTLHETEDINVAGYAHRPLGRVLAKFGDKRNWVLPDEYFIQVGCWQHSGIRGIGYYLMSTLSKSVMLIRLLGRVLATFGDKRNWVLPDEYFIQVSNVNQIIKLIRGFNFHRGLSGSTREFQGGFHVVGGKDTRGSLLRDILSVNINTIHSPYLLLTFANAQPIRDVD
ncbi:hypothetical protein J6590_075218 [Homalodisca vitripennis]|nr:hypothetical protein J6590_075218 [Homalodisca vitripennis]